jgi:hypothetical protein
LQTGTHCHGRRRKFIAEQYHKPATRFSRMGTRAALWKMLNSIFWWDIVSPSANDDSYRLE